MSQKYYSKIFEVHLGDTSAYGNAYYISYHRWIASSKEDFFNENVIGFSDLFKKDGIKLFVLSSSLRIFGESELHDKVEIRLACRALKRIKAELIFKCYNLSKNKTIVESSNNIVFVDRGNKLIPMPEPVRQALISIRETA